MKFAYIFFKFFLNFFAVGQSDAFSLLSSLTRPAGGTPTTQPPSGAAAGKQLDLNNNAFGGLIGGIFNQALSNFARPTNNNGGANIDLGGLLNPQTWVNFGNQASVQFQPQQGGGGDVSFPGKVPTTTNKTTTIKTTMNKKSSTTLTSLTNLDDVPGW